VLIPLGALDSLPPEQLRAVLAHELAHIRRHDYLINLFQLLLESTLFFHPAVWWIGARLRDEREYCCDDLAVAACGDSLIFARALSTLDALRKPDPMAPAAVLPISSQGGSLLKRITRLVDHTPRRSAGLLVSSTLAMLMLSTVAASGAVAALCDDVCLVDAVTIRDGLTVINTDGHDTDCTLLLAREDDGRMKVRCIDHILSDKLHEGHAVLPGRVEDRWVEDRFTLADDDEGSTAHIVVDLKRRIDKHQHVELEPLDEPLHMIVEDVLHDEELHELLELHEIQEPQELQEPHEVHELQRLHEAHGLHDVHELHELHELHEDSEHAVSEYILLEERVDDFKIRQLEARDRLPSRRYRKLERVHVQPAEQHVTIDVQPRVQRYKLIVEDLLPEPNEPLEDVEALLEFEDA